MLGPKAQRRWIIKFKTYWKGRLAASRSKYSVVREAVGTATTTKKYKRKRDREKRPRATDSNVQNAANDVYRLYRLWQAAYPKEYRRRKDADPVSAKIIAAEIWPVTVAEISFYMKHHNPPEIIQPKPTDA
jgi:hypothetical protein